MDIPAGYSETEVVAIIRRISRRLAYQFVFPPHTKADIKQQASLYAIEAIGRYDGRKPLANFLYVHVRNRLLNFRRDNFYRAEPPCFACPLYNKARDECTAFAERTECDKWVKWLHRNDARKRLTCLEHIETPSNIIGGAQDPVVEEVTRKELFAVLDRELPAEFRSDYRRFMDGYKLSKRRKEEMFATIKEILDRHGFTNETA